jgi:CheY-like chemotaxis protein
MLRLLVVDEALADRERIRRMAEGSGWSVDEAGSVLEMLASLRTQPACDCALIAFPDANDGDGFAALAAWKELSRVPVIALTTAECSDAPDGSAIASAIGLRLAAAGAAGYLSKDTLSQERLVQMVEAAVQQTCSPGGDGVTRLDTGSPPPHAVADAVPVSTSLPPFHRVMQSACHDLRNPLSAILINANILARSESLADERRMRTANRIISSVNRMNRIIEDLADYSLATQGKPVPIQPSDVDLVELATEVLAETRLAFSGRTMELQQSGDLRGHWDPGRLRQVLQNLLSNVLKSAPPGAVVTVTCDELPSSASVEIRLETQGQSAVSQPRAGSEMLEPGLYIARRIIEAHRGSLVAAPSLAEKTRFTVRLPQKAPHPTPTSAQTA